MKKILFTSSLFLVFLTEPALAGFTPLSCPARDSGSGNMGAYSIPDNWKNHFPFDLVYPVGSPHSDISSKCPSIVLWGYSYQLCSVTMLTQIAKTVFIVKLSIDFLTSG
jgi:hypothetical protein